jgi:adenine-specific DNA-methyltransferase
MAVDRETGALIDAGVVSDLSARLGHARYSRPGIRIYAGDCLEHMRKLPDAVINLTVTSPPYNIGKEYEKQIALDSYLDWCEQWISEVHRITAPTGAFWLNLGYLSVPGRAKALPLPYLLWPRIPFFIVQEIVWNYGAGVASRRSFSPRNEKLLWCVKDPDNYTFNLDAVRDPNVKYPRQFKNGKLKVNAAGKNPTDVWQIPKVTSGTNRASRERTPHPAQFPTALVERIVRACSNEGDAVLDPFMGSGSTAEACLRCGRPVFGFELREEYVHVAALRLNRFLREQRARLAQATLFTTA